MNNLSVVFGPTCGSRGEPCGSQSSRCPSALPSWRLPGSAGAAQEIGAAGAVNPATAGTPPGRRRQHQPCRQRQREDAGGDARHPRLRRDDQAPALRRAAGRGPGTARARRALRHAGDQPFRRHDGVDRGRHRDHPPPRASRSRLCPAPRRCRRRRGSRAEVDATNLQLSSKPGREGRRARAADRSRQRPAPGSRIQNAGIAPSLIPVQPQTTASGPVQIAAGVAIRRGWCRENLQQDRPATRRRRPRPKRSSSRKSGTGARHAAADRSSLGAHTRRARSGAELVRALQRRPSSRAAACISPVFASATRTEEDPTPKARTLQVAFGVNGSGASQSSNFMVATGAFATQPDGNARLSRRLRREPRATPPPCCRRAPAAPSRRPER